MVLLSAGMCFAQSSSKESGQNPGFPRVVARLNLFNRTKAIGPQTFYTPKGFGLFRASATIICTKPNSSTSGEWDVDIWWTNEAGLNRATLATVGTQAVQSAPGPVVFVLNATAGVPISLSTFAGGDTTEGSEYNAYIILEQLE